MKTQDFTREQIAHYILNSANESSLYEIKSILIKEKDSVEFGLLEQQLNEVDSRRERYLAGNAKVHSLKQIKQEFVEVHDLRS